MKTDLEPSLDSFPSGTRKLFDRRDVAARRHARALDKHIRAFRNRVGAFDGRARRRLWFGRPVLEVRQCRIERIDVDRINLEERGVLDESIRDGDGSLERVLLVLGRSHQVWQKDLFVKVPDRFLYPVVSFHVEQR